MELKGFNHPDTQREMRAANPSNFAPRLPRIRKPDGHIYIFSVARRHFPKTSSPYFKQPFRGCVQGERYVLCGSIPDPPFLVGPDEANGGTRLYDEPGDDAGMRVAIDLLNPNNPTNDPYWADAGSLGAFFGTSANSNLIAQGLFPSRTNPPAEKEIQRAEEVRDTRFQKLVTEALRLETFDQKALQAFIQDNPDVHPAMDALGLEAAWHKTHDLKMTCPNCGDKVVAGIAFHMFEGALCVIDWQRAVMAGRVKKSDVPDEMRWWLNERPVRG